MAKINPIRRLPGEHYKHPAHDSVILGQITALPLKPGDILVIHCCEISEAAKASLQQQLTAAFWGKPNTFLIITGKFQIAAASQPNDKQPT